MVRLLLKSGADVNAVNENRLTPLDLADSLQPMTPFGIVMIQGGMLGLLEPLGVNQTPANPLRASREEQKSVAALIVAAGGKHSQNHQPFSSRRVQP
jgi:hypothetical protein